MFRSIFVVAGAVAATSCAHVPPPATAAPAEPQPDPIEVMRTEAKALAPTVETELARQFLTATASLTPAAARVLWQDPKSERLLSAAAVVGLSDEERKALVPVSERDMQEFYYDTYYGTPLAYARPVDLLGAAGVKPGAGQHLVDFGFGHIGQLRLFAALGFEAIGVDAAHYLDELYADPTDRGPFGAGQVKIVIGKYPADAATVAAVGGDLDVFISKNTLKRGYIHPYRTPEKPEWVIDLGVTDEVFLKTVHDALKPGGKLMIYNICPALTPEDKPFVPWSDGRSPYTREQFEAAGFAVLAFDVDDTAFVRDMGKRLRWDQGPDATDLEHDLSVLYTLVERRDAPAP